MENILVVGESMFQPSFLSFLQEVASFSSHVQHQNAWFRGQHRYYQTASLHAGLFRMEKKTLRAYTEWEKEVYREFLYNGLRIHQLSSWELLYAMQHYGVKTRLLDWTESFLIALYFVFEGWAYDQKEDAVIWMLDPYRLNEKHPLWKKPVLCTTDDMKNLLGKDYPSCMNESFTNSLALFPERQLERIIVQKSVFTLQANQVPLEKEYDGALLQQGILKKVVLPFELAADVERFLVLCGVDSFMIYPDLHGLAQKVNQMK